MRSARCAVLLACAGAAVLACASGEPGPHRALGPLWREFQALPPERALAISGDPRSTRWVGAASGGHSTTDEAREEALAQCRVRRQARRMLARCEPYAVGNEIVWSP